MFKYLKGPQSRRLQGAGTLQRGVQKPRLCLFWEKQTLGISLKVRSGGSGTLEATFKPQYNAAGVLLSRTGLGTAFGTWSGWVLLALCCCACWPAVVWCWRVLSAAHSRILLQQEKFPG